MAIYTLNKIEPQLEGLIDALVKGDISTARKFQTLVKDHSQKRTGVYSKAEIVMAYRKLCDEGKYKFDQKLIQKLQMKPMRSQSGVVPVTVLSKPFECPGQCVFCPTDIRMPKSYLKDEPGAQRAENNHFDPFLQVYNRLRAFENMGHTTEKIELLVLGGTWSFYPKDYQVWFIKRCFDALNTPRTKDLLTSEDIDPKDYDPTITSNERMSVRGLPYLSGKRDFDLDKQYEELDNAQIENQNSHHRNVGLVLETRPDWITEKEVLHLRKLGATKIQIGIQSLNDDVLDINKRGHRVDATKRAIKLLRLAGFKIHAHWMPNLLGATLESDAVDYFKLWDADISPDELKIYPCSILETAELFNIYKKGEYRPYTTQELVDLLVKAVPHTPRFVRISRLIRDIPSTDIMAGNKNTNLREVIENKIVENGNKLQDIRAREVKVRDVSMDDLKLNKIIYKTGYSTEYFISYDTKSDDKIAGFLRLSIPQKKYTKNHFITELEDVALIREVHVYGRAAAIGEDAFKTSQHLGLGTLLIEEAEKISKKEGFKKLSVISAIGTREYYKKRGFELGNFYMSKKI